MNIRSMNCIYSPTFASHKKTDEELRTKELIAPTGLLQDRRTGILQPTNLATLLEALKVNATERYESPQNPNRILTTRVFEESGKEVTILSDLNKKGKIELRFANVDPQTQSEITTLVLMFTSQGKIINAPYSQGVRGGMVYPTQESAETTVRKFLSPSTV
jgi:hypothetical protein